MFNKCVLSAVFGVIGSILFLSVYNYFYVRSIGVVHVAELIGSHIDKVGVNEMNSSKQQDVAEDYSYALSNAIKLVSAEYNVLLLVAPAVISPLPDYTNTVKEKIDEIISAK